MRTEADDWGLDNEQFQQLMREQDAYHTYFEAAERVQNLSPHDDEQTRRRVARAYWQAVDGYIDSLPDNAWQVPWAKALAEYHHRHPNPAASSTTSPPPTQTTSGPCRPLRPGTRAGRAGIGRSARRRGQP
jgi:hypothetical protein